MRERAKAKLKAEEPQLLVGSPLGTEFSTWQRINNKIRDPMIVANELKRAKEHLKFFVELYREQIRGGRYFLHEHPAYATSWQTEEIEKLLNEKSVVRVTCDQCMYGCEAEDGSPVKKPTSFMSNAQEFTRELEARCNGRGGQCGRPEGGTHRQCRGKTARLAAMYHFKLCRAI